MAMNAYKWARLAQDLGSITNGPTLSAAVAAGRSTVYLAGLCGTKPEQYTARYNWWNAAGAPHDAPVVAPVIASN